MTVATAYPGGLIAISLTLGALGLGLCSLLLFVGAAVAVKLISGDRMRALLRIARRLMLGAAGAMFLSMAWETADYIRSGNVPSEALDQLLMDWPFCAIVALLFCTQIILGRLLQRRADLNRSEAKNNGNQ
jgi:hypothetical protein